MRLLTRVYGSTLAEGWLLVVGTGCVFCAGADKVFPSPSNWEEGGREKVCRKKDDWLVNRILWLII